MKSGHATLTEKLNKQAERASAHQALGENPVQFPHDLSVRDFRWPEIASGPLHVRDVCEGISQRLSLLRVSFDTEGKRQERDASIQTACALSLDAHTGCSDSNKDRVRQHGEESPALALGRTRRIFRRAAQIFPINFRTKRFAGQDTRRFAFEIHGQFSRASSIGIHDVSKMPGSGFAAFSESDTLGT